MQHVEWGDVDHTTVEVAERGANIGDDEVSEQCALVIGTENSTQVIEGDMGELLALAGMITATVHARWMNGAT